MSLTAIIGLLVSALFGGVALYFRILRNSASKRDRIHGRLEEIKEQTSRDREAMSRAKKIKDNVESLDNARLRDELGRFVRK